MTPPSRPIAAPVLPSHTHLRPLALAQVTISQETFWGTRQDLNRNAILQHSYEWMERLGWIRNFEDAAAGTEHKHRGMEFADSEIYKLIEALSWTLFEKPDRQLQGILDTLIQKVVAAQDPDGYLHTLYGRPWQAPRYSNFMWGHEMYCFGHCIQAAVAHHRTTGSTALLDAAIKLANHVCIMFGADGIPAICGHAEIEPALVELYRETSDRRYLTQANLFIDRRGQGFLGLHEFGRGYWQDDVPVREAESFHGHAVRALYLAAGAVDAAVESDDDALLQAIERQWDTTVARRTYITGGMGSTQMDEAFGEDYVLPADRAYCETCAGIASNMVSWRLLLATGEAKYADLMERTLYNIIATAPSADGKAFFYANTLHQRSAGVEPPKTEEGVAIRGGASSRQAWFQVSCCPTNLARTLGSLQGYVATSNATGVQLHQFASGSVHAQTDAGDVRLTINTAYPAEGSVSVIIDEAPNDGLELSIRVPSWTQSAALLVNDVAVPATPGTYARAHVKLGDQVTLNFEMQLRVTHPDRRIDAVRGTVAFQYGPEVLAVESTDLPTGWDLEEIRTDGRITLDASGQPMINVERFINQDASWPYATNEGVEPAETGILPLIRYHDWAERGPAAMRIFIPTK